MSGRVLVAGIGNVFFRDDGFGVEVVKRLGDEPLGEGVEVEDYGIRGVHLAFRLLEPLDLLVAVDALPRGGLPGGLYVLEADVEGSTAAGADAHGMDLPAVFAAARSMGAELPRVLVVGCEPADVTEGMGLTSAVEAAIGPAVELVRELLARHFAAADREERANEEDDESEARVAPPST